MLSEWDRIFSAELNTVFYKYIILRTSILVNIFENFLNGSPYLVSHYSVNTESMPSQKATCNTVGMEELFHSAK